jgi:hypothetical protein
MTWGGEIWSNDGWGARDQDGVEMPDEVAVMTKAMKKRIRNAEIHTMKANALTDLCTKPNPGEQWRIITEKQFNAYAFILHLLHSEEIEELHIAIYRINEPTVEDLISLIDAGRIKKATFIISSFFNQTKKPERWALRLREYCEGNPNTQHTYTWNHAKIVAAKTKTGHYVFEGSGNMSDNARIEQYLYENCEETYNFHRDWMDELCGKTSEEHR